MARSSPRPPRNAPGWGRVALLSGGLCFLLLASGLASAAAPSPFSASSNGGVEVTVPSLYPRVEISQVGNASVVSTLAIERFLETTPSSSAPSVVAVALPENITATNGSGGFPLRLAADLTVYPASAPLWSGPNDIVQPDGPPLGTARLWVNYTLGDIADDAQGVTLAWSVADWPWISDSDLLGVHLSVATPSSRSIVACTGAPSTLGTAGCPGVAVPSQGASWLPSAAALQIPFPNGPTALLHWPAGLTADGGTTAPVSVGAIAATPSEGNLVVAGAVGGASQVESEVAFSLLPPVLAVPAPLLVHGELAPYLAGALASVGVGLVGMLAYRRRAESVEREL